MATLSPYSLMVTRNSSSHLWASFPYLCHQPGPCEHLSQWTSPSRQWGYVKEDWTQSTQDPRAEHVTCSESREGATPMGRSLFQTPRRVAFVLDFSDGLKGLEEAFQQGNGRHGDGESWGLSWELTTVMSKPRDIARFPNLFPAHNSTHHRHSPADMVQVASGLKWGLDQKQYPITTQRCPLLPWEPQQPVTLWRKEGMPTSPWQCWVC